MRSTLLAGAAALALLTGTAHATLMFETGNTGGIGEVNVLFNTPDTGTTILGDVDHTGVDVSFSSLTGQTLLGSGNGQADIVVSPVVNPPTLMTSIDMRAQTGTAWTDAILDMDDSHDACGGGSGTCGVANIVATDNMGQSFQTALMNGTNFVTIQAVAGTNEFITDLQVTMLSPDPVTGFSGWEDFKQPRVSGLCDLVTSTSCVAVPIAEPSSLGLLGAALSGLGLLGVVRVWRRGRGLQVASSLA